MAAIYKAAKPTRTYTIFESKDMAPNIAATRSKLNKPTSPQFNPPTITKIIEIIFNVFTYTSSLLSLYFLDYLKSIKIKNRLIPYILHPFFPERQLIRIIHCDEAFRVKAF